MICQYDCEPHICIGGCTRRDKPGVPPRGNLPRVTVDPVLRGFNSPAPQYNVGDIVLTGIKSQGAVSYLIKAGAFVAGYPAEARRFAHSAVIVSTDGAICEAVSHGIRYEHISRFPDGDTVVIPMGVTAWDAAQVQAYCHRMVADHTGYGYGTFAAAGFNCAAAGLRLGGHGIYFGIGHSRICSVMCAEALTRAGVYWDVDPSAIMPADIWMQFGHKARSLSTYRKD